MKTIKRILSVHKVVGFKVFCLFNNGESRIIDFEALFKKWHISESDVEYLIATKEKEFQKFEGKKVTVTGIITEDTSFSEPSLEEQPVSVDIPCFITIASIHLAKE